MFSLRNACSSCRIRLVLATVLGAMTGSAATITLTSQNNGQFTYGLTLSVGESVSFNPGQQIALTGLADVIASSTGSFFAPAYTASSTPTSVGFTNTSGVLNVFLNNTAGTLTFGNLSVISTSNTLGLINYQIANGTAPAFTGTVLGPVAASAVPEPATNILLGLGIALLVILRNRAKPFVFYATSPTCGSGRSAVGSI